MYSRARSACRVRLYMPAEEDEALGEAPVVIISELANNPGTSVRGAIEQMAAEVIATHDLETAPVFVEHYPLEATRGPEEAFSLVVFSHHEVKEVLRAGIWRKELGSPTRKPLDHCAVEVLVDGLV